MEKLCSQTEELVDGLAERDPQRKVDSAFGESSWQLCVTTTPQQDFILQAIDVRQPQPRETKSYRFKFMK